MIEVNWSAYATSSVRTVEAHRPAAVLLLGFATSHGTSAVEIHVESPHKMPVKHIKGHLGPKSKLLRMNALILFKVVYEGKCE